MTNTKSRRQYSNKEILGDGEAGVNQTEHSGANSGNGLL